jgi:hypothetical protein
VSRIRERLSQVLVDAKEVLWNFRAEADDQSEQIHELAPVIVDYIRMRLKEYPEQGVSRTRGCCRSGRADASISRGRPRNQEDAGLTGKSRICSENRFQRHLGDHRSPFRALFISSSRKVHIIGEPLADQPASVAAPEQVKSPC